MIAVFVIDSASETLLNELLAGGRLPTLAALRQAGRWYDFERRPDQPHAEHWHATLYTGYELEDHGLYYLFQWVAEDQRIRYLDSLPKPETVWERLSRGRRRCLVLDPYEAWPPNAIDGICMSGWQFNNRFVLRRWSAPAHAERRLTRQFGHSTRIEDVYGRPTPRLLLKMLGPLLAAPARIADVACSLLSSERFDLLWLGFSAVHVGGHHFWDLSQVDPNRLNAQERAIIEEALTELYVRVDDAMAKVLDALPDDADIIVTSPIGMDVNTSRSDLLPEMLMRVLAQGNEVETDGSAQSGAALWRLRAAVPSEWRAQIAKPLPGRVVRDLNARLFLRGVDWSSTKAFVVPGEHNGFVRVNLRGREREGIVEPAEVDDLLDKIASGLLTFTDPDGAPAVEAVHRTAAASAQSNCVRRLPDLVIQWSDVPATRLSGVQSPEYGNVRRYGAGTGRSGNHKDGAWALVVPRSSAVQKLHRPARLVDIAPTICSVSGIDGSGLFGQPLLA